MSWVRLLQLCSPALPVGAYSYSQGLEWAIEAGWVKDVATAEQWIGEVFVFSMASFELPLLADLLRAWRADNAARVLALNELYLASRETRELYEESRQMGYSALHLIEDLGWGSSWQRARLLLLPEVAFPTAWALAASSLDVDIAAAVQGYAYAWLENQVMAALKTVPLGQVAGQRLLAELGGRVPACVERALHLDEAEWCNLAPGLAMASSRHETQYSRLFRS